VGTSTKWAGPAGDSWIAVRRSLGQPLPASELPVPIQRGQRTDEPPVDAGAEARGRRLFAALKSELRADQDAFGLRKGLGEAAVRLVETATWLTEDLTTFGPPPADWPAEPADWFTLRFVESVAGQGIGLTDMLIRRSATNAAERVLADPAVGRALAGEGWLSRLAMDLFCLIYQAFFADVIREFAAAVVAEKVKLAAPILIAVDPGDRISGWIGDQVAAVIPNPCEQGRSDSGDERSMSELAADVVWDNVDRALGLPVDGAT
jgi:hypothetical protein